MIDFSASRPLVPTPRISRPTPPIGFSERPASKNYSFDKPLLGNLLLSRGVVTRYELGEALKNQTKWHVRLGAALLAAGALSEKDLYSTLSVQSGIPFVDLSSTPCDLSGLKREDVDFYLKYQCLPWRTLSNQEIWVAADVSIARAALKNTQHSAIMIYQTAPKWIGQTVRARFEEHFTARACFQFDRNTPTLSARTLFPFSTRVKMLSSLMVFVILASLFPTKLEVIGLALIGLIYSGLAGLRIFSIAAGLHRAPGRSNATVRPALTDAELPSFTVMLPLLREGGVLPDLVSALKDLDYPAAKLDIKFLIERTDTETRTVADRLLMPSHFEVVLVPESLPLTKPKACNYALPFARGDYLVIYDAEDLPEAGQLREAADAFHRADETVACFQAPLNFYNWRENWLTRQFTLEYTSLFDLLLPALHRLRLPLPLGGTSTHFRTKVLREVGAWDPFNVTEDADLGYRLAAAGYQTGVLRGTTNEEANCELGNWIRQRSRWLKGWMQTYIVHMRNPRRLWRQLGPAGFCSFQLVIGGFVLCALLHPWVYVLLVGQLLLGDAPVAVPHLSIHVLVFVAGYASTILAAMAGAANRGYFRLLFSALGMPFYWLLISCGAYMGLFQLFTKPHYWEKTQHALSRMSSARQRHIRQHRTDPNRTALPAKT
ncbi:MAG: glycosyltransferase [Parvibaculaceae bacterium]|nr:glycosyltransferase [Parvibaculaceae bacterium]